MDQPSSRKKILCIDDTPEVRRLVLRLLSGDYVVLEAADGLQGIDTATKHRPDLVLVDLHMPHLTGYEVATRLKALLPQVPIVALTADVTANVRERALASGCDGYISKPLDVDRFPEQVASFLAGAREQLQDESHRQAYQQVLVARLEEKVRELTEALKRNAELNEQNFQLLKRAQRQAHLLEAGARVGRSITSILNLDLLLKVTVDTICDEFGFYYAGIFLLDETGEWAILRAGRGEAGATLLERGHRLRVGGQSLIGVAAWLGKARIALDVGQEPARFNNPLLPLTRSEVALPLFIGGEVIGALSVQSTEEAAFSEADVVALQMLADQLAVAIKNARLLQDLEATHAELVRTKTFEAIATATGEAIHWVGNKAAPVPGSVARITEDVSRYLWLAAALLEGAPPELREHRYAQVLLQAAEALAAHGFSPDATRAELEPLPLKRLQRLLSVDSILEDLHIIEQSARAILSLKEDLIGPARQYRVEDVALADLLQETVAAMGIPASIVTTDFAPEVPRVRADAVQLERVFINLIKNAMEAMHEVEEKRLHLRVRPAEPGFVAAEVGDNGCGIPPDQLDKIWMAFYTTKGDRGGTGLGLPACAQIIGQLGGKIIVHSQVGVGTTFVVILPQVKPS